VPIFGQLGKLSEQPATIAHWLFLENVWTPSDRFLLKEPVNGIIGKLLSDLASRAALGCTTIYDYVIMRIMSSSRSRTSRVFTISFPEDLAAQVEEVAKQESRNISELFREAFRTYRLERMQRKLSAVRGAVAARTRPRYREEDVEQLVNEIRTELSSGKKRKA
jgi:metal-responsive CopG/Arc/MetJ family transcriptional regulator